jgi:hypothetical protein
MNWEAYNKEIPLGLCLEIELFLKKKKKKNPHFLPSRTGTIFAWHNYLGTKSASQAF